MALPTNPIATTISNATSLVSNAASSGVSALTSQATAAASQLSSVNGLVNTLGGGIGSKLNGVTGLISSGTGVAGAVQTALSGGGLSSITDTINGKIGSITETLAGGISPDAIGGLINSGLKQAAAAGAKFASIASDLIATARSKNLPSAATLGLTQPASIVAVYPSATGDWRVKLQSFAGDIIFPVTPTFSLTHTANYDVKPLVHSNFPIPVYTHSSSGDISISCEWPVETAEEADEWYRVLHLGRALTKMFYGSSPNLGNPPPICTLVGYESTLYNIPVVVKEFKVDFKDDVHFIKNKKTYVPRLSTVSITLTPIYSKSSQRGFNWDQYANATSAIPY